jgi:hypothetical protein
MGGARLASGHLLELIGLVEPVVHCANDVDPGRDPAREEGPQEAVAIGIGRAATRAPASCAIRARRRSRPSRVRRRGRRTTPTAVRTGRSSLTGRACPQLGALGRADDPVRLPPVCAERLWPIERRTAVRTDVLLRVSPSRGRLLRSGLPGSPPTATGGSGSTRPRTHRRILSA